MNVWEIIDSATVPGSEGVLSLHQCGDAYTIFVDGRRLMDSRVSASERILASLASRHVADKTEPVVLIGGLGMGLTLHEALIGLPANARVEVAELVPAVVRWNREWFGALSGHAVDDARVVIREDDVAECLKSSANTYDAILLDVDNGPNALTRTINEWLYTVEGLTVAFDALRPGGVLNIWSAADDDIITRRLETVGFMVHVETVMSEGPDEGEHSIWVAERP